MIQIIRFDKKLYSQAAIKRAISAFEKHMSISLIDIDECFVVMLLTSEGETENFVGDFSNFVIHMENQYHHVELL